MKQQVWRATTYDEQFSFVYTLAGDLVDDLAPQPGETVLDVGCGTGILTNQIAGRGARTIGIDASPEMIGRARAAFPSLDFRVMDAREIGLDEPVDAVFSNAVLHWIPDVTPVIRGIAGVLRPGGRLVMEFGGAGNLARIVAAVDRARQELGQGQDRPNPWYNPGAAALASLLQAHGLEPVLVRLFPRPTPLAGGAQGLRDWLDMFGAPLFQGLDAASRDAVCNRVEDLLKPVLWNGDYWVADYRRIRATALRH